MFPVLLSKESSTASEANFFELLTAICLGSSTVLLNCLLFLAFQIIQRVVAKTVPYGRLGMKRWVISLILLSIYCWKSFSLAFQLLSKARKNQVFLAEGHSLKICAADSLCPQIVQVGWYLQIIVVGDVYSIIHR